MKPSIKAACFSGLIFPGTGQLYLKHYTKATLFIVIAALSFYLIMSAVFNVAFEVVEQIQNGNINSNNLDVTTLVSQAMTVFDEPTLMASKITFVVCWILSTLDAWISGKKLDNKS